MQKQEDHSNLIPALNVDSLKVNLVVIHNTCSEKEESNSETASSKSVKECNLNSETKDVHAIKYKMSKVKGKMMEYFQSLHSHLQSKIDTGKALDNGLVVMESNGTESEVQDDSSRDSSKNNARFNSMKWLIIYYLDEARKKRDKERDRTQKTSMMPSVDSCTTDASNQSHRKQQSTSRSLLVFLRVVALQ
ncbi:hypothetical protein Tco_1089241 [Tanacetum coccineum]